MVLGIAGFTALLYLAHHLGILGTQLTLKFSLGITLATGSGTYTKQGANSMKSKLMFRRIGFNPLLRSHGLVELIPSERIR